MVKTLDKIARGDGEPEDLEILLRVSNTMDKTSLCGSGQSAHNPVLSTLRNFLGEYKTHIHQKYCPAAVCTDLFDYYILPEKCNGCGLCVESCTEGAIRGKRRELHTLDTTLCIKCRTCLQTCHHDAIVGIPIASKTNTPALAEMILW
jgi:ferredoxin